MQQSNGSLFVTLYQGKTARRIGFSQQRAGTVSRPISYPQQYASRDDVESPRISLAVTRQTVWTMRRQRLQAHCGHLFGSHSKQFRVHIVICCGHRLEQISRSPAIHWPEPNLLAQQKNDTLQSPRRRSQSYVLLRSVKYQCLTLSLPATDLAPSFFKVIKYTTDHQGAVVFEQQ